MINKTLYMREMKVSLKLLLVLAAVLTLYVLIIISMYEPEMMAMLDGFAEMMPGIMAAVGMKAGAADLLGFMVSYLYGFILLIFPMIFCIVRGNGLIARYVDRGSMVYLAASPVKRSVIATTQAAVMLTGIVILVCYVTVLEILSANYNFPKELEIDKLLILNTGLAALQFAIGGICFLTSCIFSDIKYSLGFGAGIPLLMYVLQMLANAGEKAEIAKYFSIFTLFDPEGIAAGESAAMAGVAVLFILAGALFAAAIIVFTGKDLHI